MKKILLYIFFSIGWYHPAFGRSIVEGNDKRFLIAKNAVDTCNSQTFRIEKAGDVLRTVEPVLSENDFTYQWYKNGEKIVNATGTTLQTREAGYYTLKRISKTNTACVKTSDNFISVYSPDSGSPLWISVDYKTNKLTTTPTMAGSTIEWYRNNQLIAGQNTASINYQADGIYQVKEIYDNITKVSNELVFNTGVAVEIIKETYFQLGDPCRPGPYLKCNFISDIPVEYQWYFNGVPVKDSTNIHFNPVTTGEYQVSVHIPVRNRTYVSGRYKLIPYDFPKSLPITKIDDACNGNAILTVSDTFMQKYQFQSIVWRLDGQDIPYETNPYYKATKSGYYTFSVKYLIDAKSSECNYNSFIEFNKKPDSDLNAGYAYAGSGCAVDSFKVFVEYNRNYGYSWVKNDTVLKNQNGNELFIKDKGIYKAIINKGAGCIRETNPITLKGCTSANSNQFLILNPPVVVADKTTVFANEQSFVRVNGCANVNFQWLKDAEPIAGANLADFEIRQSGTYRLQIEKLGCTAISAPVRIIVENILSPEPETEMQIRVSPNPFNESVSIELPASVNKGTQVKLTDITGKLIRNYKIEHKHSLELGELPDGVYLLNFELDKKRVVKKIVKGG